eukprot:128062_1
MTHHSPKKIELCNPVKIADTLQAQTNKHHTVTTGSIWRASIPTCATSDGETVVIKVTSQYAQRNSVSVIDNKEYLIRENILLEQSILKYLTQRSDCPQGITKFIAFNQTHDAFHLIMEDGGGSLFDFVSKVHGFIRGKVIDISHWKQVVKVIFKQMIECIDFIHSNNVCHNDISLENFVINDVPIYVDESDKTGKLHFITDGIRIKLCDFGLAELHTNKECLSNKHCGKTNYRSPEVASKKRRFAGKKNDIWCVGCVLFMLLFGCQPFGSASVEDAAFRCIINGDLVDLLFMWNLCEYGDKNSINLLQSIFQYEEQRICVGEMEKHPFLN